MRDRLLKALFVSITVALGITLVTIVQMRIFLLLDQDSMRLLHLSLISFFRISLIRRKDKFVL